MPNNKTGFSGIVTGTVCIIRRCEDILLLYHLVQLFDIASLACIVNKHFINFFLIIAGDAVRNNMNHVTGLSHIVAGGFHTGGCICAGNVKLLDLVFIDECSKCITC